VTRFKELVQIESAIEHQNESQLRWALSYCKMRLSIAVSKEHIQYWKKIETDVLKALQLSS
jgi:hypothetical protein